MAYMTAQQALLRGIPVFTIPESYYIRVPIRWEDKTYILKHSLSVMKTLFQWQNSLKAALSILTRRHLCRRFAPFHGNRNLFMADAVQVGPALRHFTGLFRHSLFLD